ncbi:MAG: hypothetical protein V2B14_00550 [bacterium]
MKKFKIFLILISVLILFVCLRVEAFDDKDYISNIEQNLFNAQFQNDSVNNRLNRIEINAFGKASADTYQQRIQRLKNTFKNQYQVVSKTPVSTPALSNEPQIDPYIIDELENKVLSRSFSNENINRRIERLEIIMFNRNFNETWDERVNRLYSVVFGNQNESSASTKTNNSMDENSINSLLTQLEKQTFNQVYIGDSIENRMARLENSIFNEVSSDSTVDERLERLATVIQAQASSDIYKDMSALRQYKTMNTSLTAATILLLLLRGLFF